MKTLAHLLILRTASWIVPRAARADWLAEWTAELWYVERQSARATQFCLGALRDAWWLRRNNLNPIVRQLLRMESPLHCLAVLAGIAAVMVLLALNVPAARNLFIEPPYRDPHSLLMLSIPPAHSGKPTVSIEKYQHLSAAGDRWFSSMAFYQPTSILVRNAGPDIVISAARASSGLFDLLGVPLARSSGPPALVLRQSAWRRLHGRGIVIDGRPVDSAAVIPDSAWRLAGHFDAWLLENDSQLAALPLTSMGFAVARDRAPTPRRSYWYVSVPKPADERDLFECTPPFPRGDLLNGVVSLLAFCFILLAATRASLGEEPMRRELLAAPRLRRWTFLLVKTGLVFVILTGGLCIAINSPIPQMALASFMLAFRWVLYDQRRRCPVCLHVLTNPVRIGRPSQTFLEWYGTELMCAHGHGLLHVSEATNSCYSRQQWTGLDASWSSLFTQPAGQAATR